MYFLIVLLSLFAQLRADEPPVPPVQGQPQEQVEEVPAPPSYEHALGKMLLTLLGLIVLIFLTVWVMRKLTSGRVRSMNQNRAIRILEKRPLSQKSVLYLVEIEGKQVLLSESQLEVRALTTVETTSRENS